MLDIQFLNERAKKLRSSLKKVKQILDLGKDEFMSVPMYPDRTQYYMVIAYDELEKIACHIYNQITGEKVSENCLEKVSQTDIFSGKINRAIQDFIKFKKDLFESGFKYSPEEMFFTVKNILDSLYEPFIRELSQVVKELKEKQPKLSIPVNLKKVNQQAKAIKSELKKIETLLKYPEEEFIKSDFAMDRGRYFAVVTVDSALWICRHIARQLKLKPSKNCFENLKNAEVLKEETAKKLEKIVSYRDIFADPEKHVDPKELYRILKEEFPVFLEYIKEISQAIFGKHGKEKSP